MRIIAGFHSGRLFDAPLGKTTHPMAERIRGALFNSLGDLTGYTVLDAYGGTGAIAFEAVSRGATSAIIVERATKTFKVLSKNVDKLGLQNQIKATRANIITWLKHNPDYCFDIIFCDPPFDELREDVIEMLARHLNSKGLMVLSKAGRGPAPTVNGVVVVDVRNYGDAELVYYRSTK